MAEPRSSPLCGYSLLYAFFPANGPMSRYHHPQCTDGTAEARELGIWSHTTSHQAARFCPPIPRQATFPLSSFCARTMTLVTPCRG